MLFLGYIMSRKKRLQLHNCCGSTSGIHHYRFCSITVLLLPCHCYYHRI